MLSRFFDYSPSGLDYFFAAIILLSVLVLVVTNRKGSRSVSRLDSQTAGFKHIFNFVLGMTLSFGLVGLLATHGGAIYSALGASSFFGADNALGDEGFVGLLALVVGVPVALAGSVYAVILAFQSISLTERGIEYARKERVDRQHAEWKSEVATITRNYLDLGNALQHMNALASSDLERMLFKLSRLGSTASAGTSAGNARYAEAVLAVLDHDSTQDIRTSFQAVLDAVRRIQAHPRSCKLMERLIAAKRGDLRGAKVLEWAQQNSFESPGHAEWFAYAAPDKSDSERVDELVDALGLLQVQAFRITPADTIVSAVRIRVDEVISNLRDGIKFQLSRHRNMHEAFYGDWLSTPVRKRAPEYYLSYWLRMLLDINVKKGANKDLNDISFADVVVTDLHLLIPNQQELQDFLRVEKNFWDELGSLEVDKMIAGIEYPAKANISIPAREWVATSSIERENEDSRPLLRFPFSPSPGKLLDALRTGNDEFFKEWFSVVRSLAARTILESELWFSRSRSADDLRKALDVLQAMEEIACFEDDVIALQWALSCARFKCLVAGLDGTQVDNSWYASAISLAGKEGICTQERQLGVLLEAGQMGMLNSRMQETAAAGGLFDWVAVLQAWFDGLCARAKPIYGDELFVLPREVAEAEGLFPLFLWKLRAEVARPLRFRVVKSSLVEMVVLPDEVSALPFDPDVIRRRIEDIFSTSPSRADDDMGGICLDPLFEEWNEFLKTNGWVRDANDPTTYKPGR